MPGDEGSPRQCPWMKDLESGKEVRWMNSKVSYKQGESDNIIEVKLGLLNLRVSSVGSSQPI
jgi:hypothetical protein